MRGRMVFSAISRSSSGLRLPVTIRPMIGIIDGSNLNISGVSEPSGRKRLTISMLSRTELAASAMSVP